MKTAWYLNASYYHSGRAHSKYKQSIDREIIMTNSIALQAWQVG